MTPLEIQVALIVVYKRKWKGVYSMKAGQTPRAVIEDHAAMLTGFRQACEVAGIPPQAIAEAEARAEKEWVKPIGG